MNNISITRNRSKNPIIIAVDDMEDGKPYKIINTESRFNNHAVIRSNQRYAVIGESVTNQFVITDKTWLTHTLTGSGYLVGANVNINIAD